MKEILAEIPHAKLKLMELNLGELSSVRKFANDDSSKHAAIHLLINNAGVNASKVSPFNYFNCTLHFVNFILL